jgi:hypothetical protein
MNIYPIAKVRINISSFIVYTLYVNISGNKCKIKKYLHKFSTFQSEYKQLPMQLSLQTWTCEVSNILWENYHYIFKSINRVKDIFKAFL